MQPRPDTILSGSHRYDVVDVDLDVVPASERSVTYTVTDRFLVVSELHPAPPAEHPHAALVGRIWPATGTVRAYADGVHLVLQIDHGRVYAQERTTNQVVAPEAALP